MPRKFPEVSSLELRAYINPESLPFENTSSLESPELNMLLSDVDPKIVLEHWTGKADLLVKVREILAQADQLIGKGRLDKILESIGVRKPATGAGA